MTGASLRVHQIDCETDLGQDSTRDLDSVQLTHQGSQDPWGWCQLKSCSQWPQEFWLVPFSRAWLLGAAGAHEEGLEHTNVHQRMKRET